MRAYGLAKWGKNKQKLHKQKHRHNCANVAVWQGACVVTLSTGLHNHHGHWQSCCPKPGRILHNPWCLGKLAHLQTSRQVHLWLVQLSRKREIKSITGILSFYKERWIPLHRMRSSPHIRWKSRGWMAKMKNYPLPTPNKVLRRLAKNKSCLIRFHLGSPHLTVPHLLF